MAVCLWFLDIFIFSIFHADGEGKVLAFAPLSSVRLIVPPPLQPHDVPPTGVGGFGKAISAWPSLLLLPCSFGNSMSHQTLCAGESSRGSDT